MKKRTFILLSLVVILSLGLAWVVPVPLAHAISPLVQNHQAKVEEKASASAQREQTLLTTIISTANTMIQNRIADLQKLTTRLTSDKRLPSSDKDSMTTSLTTTITDLKNLQAKIDADTDSTTARDDRKSIVTGYKIYAIYEPRTRLLVIIDNLQTSANTVGSLSARLQTLLNTLQSQGKNVTSAQNSLNDMNSQLSKINTSLTADKSLITNVTISTQNPQSVFVTVRQNLSNLRFDFAQIRLDIAQLRTQLHSSTSPTPTLTPSPTK
ncbi:MAG TPA: hypothetical protein VN711_04760 [Candidatus Saccharimonadales bacterium]|nr:hypothetical protein [Candidatus Saccharimonadales bacterium]